MRQMIDVVLVMDNCRYFVALIVGAIQGASKEKLLSKRYTPIPDYWKKHPLVLEMDAVSCGSFKERQPPRIRGSGHVVASLEAAQWAFYRSPTNSISHLYDSNDLA